MTPPFSLQLEIVGDGPGSETITWILDNAEELDAIQEEALNILRFWKDLTGIDAAGLDQ